MMFAIVWVQNALDELADVFVEAELTEQDRMTSGIEALNRRLTIEPTDEGESRWNGYRVTFPHGLVVIFHVNIEDQIVHVMRVKRSGRAL